MRGLLDRILGKLGDDHQYDCGWTAVPLSSSANAYSAAQKPIYRRYGKVVELRGAASPKSQVASGGTLTIGTLPEHYRPWYLDVYNVCQGSGHNKWLLHINTGGVITAERYGVSSGAAIPTNVWLLISISFIVND